MSRIPSGLLRAVAVAAIAVVSGAMAAAAPGAAAEADYEARLAAAVGLHDGGQYEAAIGAFRDLLTQRPDDPKLLCELANSCLAARKYEDAVRHAEAGLARPGADRATCSNILGSALDGLGEMRQGEKVFRKAIKESPGAAFLRFNLGINLGQQNRLEEATEEFQEAIRIRPAYASAWRALAIGWMQSGLRPRAFAGFARFLTLEPAGARAEAAAKQLRPLLFQGVDNLGADASGNDEIKINLDPDAMKKDKVTGALNLGMSTVAATRWTGEWKDRTDAEFFAHGFTSLMAIFEEAGVASGKEGAFWRDALLPYFRDARAAGHLEAMAWDIRRSLNAAEVGAWLEAHKEAVERYRAWSSAWTPAAPSPAP